MEDSKIVICRLCLNFTTFDECQILDAVSRDMLKFIVPEVDLDISQDPKICQTCYKTVLRCYRFKSNCNKDINTEIKKNLEEESDSISIEIDDVENKCNFCLNSRDNEDVEEFNDRKTYFTEVLQKCLSEWNLSSKTIPCKKCLDVLTSQFTFIGNCVDTEDKLKHYRLTHGTNSKGKLNLYEAVQHILSKESRDLDVMIKADQEIPFPELVVNTDTLKMEEVDIKSEVMDEDYSEFEEEPGSSGSEKHHGTSKDVKCRQTSSQSCQDTELIEAKKENNKTAEEKNYCWFCKTEVMNFTRHIIKNHETEIEVQKILSKPVNTRERRILINILRKKGNLMKNLAEECVKPHSSILPNNSYLSGHNCLGFYSSKLLYRHRKRCVEKSKSENHLNLNNIHDVTNKETKLMEVDRIEKNKKVVRLRDFCCFCETEVLNFARHICRNHRTEKEVQKVLSNPINTRERRILINLLRNRGNFLRYYAQDSIKPVRKAALPNKSHLPCPNCLGFFSAKLLYRHKKNCPKNSNVDHISQVSGQNRLVAHLKIDKRLKELVFPHMRADSISLAAKRDSLICAFGARYLKIHCKKYFIHVTSAKMRALAKILMEMKKMQPSVKNMFEALQPEHYHTLVEASKIGAKYNMEKGKFGAPTFAVNISTSLKQCCYIAIHFVLKKQGYYRNVDAIEAETKLKTTIHLLRTKWKLDISSRITRDLNVNEWNKLTVISLVRDLKLLTEYLKRKAEEALFKLSKDNEDVNSYITLIETVLCRIILLNRNCPVPLQQLTLYEYECECKKRNFDKFENSVSSIEKILLDKLKYVVIKGNTGRGVPVLFCDGTQQHIKKLIHIRSNFVAKENLYLFGTPVLSTPICHYKVLEKYSTACGATDPKSLTSTQLRKHVATLSQIFLLSASEIEQFLGRTVKFHSLHDDVYDTAKLYKLSLLTEKGNAAEYTGKSLDEISVNVDDNLLKDEISSDESGDDFASNKNVVPQKEKNDSDIKKTPVHRKKNRRVLVPWSDEQKSIVEEFFKGHIENRKAAKRGECEKLINQFPEIFRNKSWEKIKVYVQNKYTKKSV